MVELPAFTFDPDGIEREALRVDEAEIESRIAICYTGEPRLSGTNNWEIFKRHIDGDPELFELFDGIRDSAQQMREALLADDWTRSQRNNAGRLSKSKATCARESLRLKWNDWWRLPWPMALKQQRFAAPAVAAASRFFVPKDGRPMWSGR